MEQNKLNSWIYRQLAAAADAWLSFDELDKLLTKETPDWTDTVRRSYLRGEVGRMLRAGQIIRKKTSAEYQLGDDVNLFQETIR